MTRMYPQNHRKTLTRTLAALVLLVFALSVHAAHQLGDLAPRGNPDGVLNAGDLVVLKQLVSGALTPTADELIIGDVAPLDNTDGVLNAGDVIVLTRAIFGEVTLGTVNLGPDLNEPGISVTNDNPFTITGNGSPNTNIEIYVNDNYQQQVTSDLSGNFSVGVYLFDGENDIYAIENDGAVSSGPSNTIQIQYDNNISRSQSGTISVDTVWTPGTPGIPVEPYIITNYLTVASGVSLVIQPGTIVKFNNGYRMIVKGTLEVRGTASQMITFTSSNDVNPTVSSWSDVKVEGAATIDYALFEWGDRSVWVDGTSAQLTLSNSIIKNSRFGVYATNVIGGVVTNNTINDITFDAMFLNNSYLVLNENTITCKTGAGVTPSGYGIELHNSSPDITGNTIQVCSIGMFFRELSSPLVNGDNIIIGNNTGVTLLPTVSGDPEPVINGNQIYDNINRQFTINGGYSDGINTRIDATGNYWGTTNVINIAESILDHKTNSTAAVADFTPFLDSSNGSPYPGNYIDGGEVTQNINIASGEEYFVTGDAVIPVGFTLTANPDSELTFVKDAGLTVRGGLTLAGSDNNLVLLSSKTPEALNLDEDARGDWDGVIVESTATSVSIDYAAISWAETAVNIQNASGTSVTNSVINYFNTAGVVYDNVSSGTFNNNVVFNQIGSPVGIFPGVGLDLNQSNITIDGNSIHHNNTGVVLNSSSPVITNNKIFVHQVGMNMDSSSPAIQANDIYNNNTGIAVAKSSSPSINGDNLIHDNGWGISVFGDNLAGNNPDPVVNNNSFYNNSIKHYDASNFYDDNNVVLDATHNWWGTDDINQIIQKLSDPSHNTRPDINIFPYEIVKGGTLSNTTALSGTLTGNTVLAPNTTYYVTHLTVPQTYTLTVQEGVKLLFTRGSALTIEGTLDAQGSPDNPILFTSVSASPVRGDWDGITFTSTAANGVINNAIISWARAAVTVDGASNISITNNEVSDFDEFGIQFINGATGQITSNEVHSALVGSIVCVAADAASPTIDNNTIYDCGEGVRAYNGAAPNITNNYISNSSTGIVIESSSPLVDSNVIDGNKFTGIGIYRLYGSTASNPLIINNQISNTTTGSGIKIFGTGNDDTNPQPVINDNDIFGNRDFGLVVSNYGTSSMIVLDVTNNYWGGGAPSVDIASNSPSGMVNSTPYSTNPLQGPVISGVNATNIYISPNTDGLKDDTIITASLSETADWTVAIYNGDGTVPIRNFPPGNGTAISVTWDGTNDSSVLQAEGAYQVRISATAGGRTAIDNNTITVFIDTTGPAVDITEPVNNATYTSVLSVPVIGTITDLRPTTFTVEYGQGLTPTAWTPIVTDQGAPLTLAMLVDWIVNTADGTAMIQNGDYTLRITAKDGADNSSITDIVVTIDNITITSVTKSTTTFNPAAGETATINFTINVPATVTLNITDHMTGLIARSIPVVYSTSGPKSIPWDGLDDMGNHVPDEAYTYTLTATSGVRTAEYTIVDPVLSGTVGGGSNIPYDATTNIFWKNFITMSSPVRLRLRISCINSATCVTSSFYEYFQTPFEDDAWLYWNGRDPEGNEIDGNDYRFFVHGITRLPTNILIVKGTEPFITGEGGPAAAPDIEVKSNPHTVTHSYEEFSQIKFQVDQDSLVTIKLLPPGINDLTHPDTKIMRDDSAVQFDNVLLTAGTTYTIEWAGYDTTAAESENNNILVDPEGMYTFAIEAVGQVTGFKTLYRGALNLYH